MIKNEETDREKLLNEITEYVFEVFFNQIRCLSPEIWTELRFGIPIETKQKVERDISEILKL